MAEKLTQEQVMAVLDNRVSNAVLPFVFTELNDDVKVRVKYAVKEAVLQFFDDYPGAEPFRMEKGYIGECELVSEQVALRVPGSLIAALVRRGRPIMVVDENGNELTVEEIEKL